MRIGQLNRRVMLQAPSRIDNGIGGKSKTYVDIGAISANMIPLRGDQALEQTLLQSKQLWKVTIRHRNDVSTDHRLIYDGRPLAIKACEDPDGKRKWLVLTCESGGRT